MNTPPSIEPGQPWPIRHDIPVKLLRAQVVDVIFHERHVLKNLGVSFIPLPCNNSLILGMMYDPNPEEGMFNVIYQRLRCTALESVTSFKVCSDFEIISDIVLKLVFSYVDLENLDKFFQKRLRIPFVNAPNRSTMMVQGRPKCRDNLDQQLSEAGNLVKCLLNFLNKECSEEQLVCIEEKLKVSPIKEWYKTFCESALWGFRTGILEAPGLEMRAKYIVAGCRDLVDDVIYVSYQMRGPDEYSQVDYMGRSDAHVGIDCYAYMRNNLEWTMLKQKRGDRSDWLQVFSKKLEVLGQVGFKYNIALGIKVTQNELLIKGARDLRVLFVREGRIVPLYLEEPSENHTVTEVKRDPSDQFLVVINGGLEKGPSDQKILASLQQNAEEINADHPRSLVDVAKRIGSMAVTHGNHESLTLCILKFNCKK